MSDKKITYDDVKEYEHLFTKAPSLILSSFIKRESNLVGKFQSKIESMINNLDSAKKEKLNIILESDVSDLQDVMKEAYDKTNKKQYKLLANPKARNFIEVNLDEIRKMV